MPNMLIFVGMTTKEVCKAIRADSKCYALIRMPRSTFCETLRQIELGKARPRTLKEFFGRFNYCPVNNDPYALNEWEQLK